MLPNVGFFRGISFSRLAMWRLMLFVTKMPKMQFSPTATSWICYYTGNWLQGPSINMKRFPNIKDWFSSLVKDLAPPWKCNYLVLTSTKERLADSLSGTLRISSVISCSQPIDLLCIWSKVFRNTLDKCCCFMFSTTEIIGCFWKSKSLAKLFRL